jgi:hypothetical protein
MTTTFEKPAQPFQNLSMGMEHKQDLGHKEPRKIREEIEPTTEEDVSFFHDFLAGGVAGSASVVVGHPFDTIKVRDGESYIVVT